MTFEAWLLLIHLKATSFCDSLISPQVNCVEIVKECVLDGESFEWCTENYSEI